MRKNVTTIAGVFHRIQIGIIMQAVYKQCPKSMSEDVFQADFPMEAGKRDQVFQRLQLRETFTKGQIFPYRVEFESDQTSGPFLSGEMNIHHGPLLSAH